MEQKGYVIVRHNTNGELIFAVKVDVTSKWITLYSNAYDGDPDALEDYGAQLSQIFKSPALCTSCFDSDFLLLHLIGASKNSNTYAIIGHPYDDISLPAVNYSAWGPYMVEKEKNISFKEICESDYVFAEDALVPIGEYLGLYAQDLNMPFSEIEDVVVTYKFCFAKPESKISNGDHEPVNLQHKIYSLTPAFLDHPSIVSFINHGGASKGIAVYFIGGYVKEDMITFSPVELYYFEHKNKKSRNEMCSIPLNLEKVQLKDDTFAYYAECPEFEIPEKVNSSLKGKKLDDEQYARTFGVRFVPHGDGKQILDITVVVIPMQNFENQVVWNAWHLDGSKEAYIDNYNTKWERTRKHNPKVDDMLLDKDFYLK
jgi:hypothetical protein